MSAPLDKLSWWVDDVDEPGHMVVRDSRNAPVALVPDWMGKDAQKQVAALIATGPELLDMMKLLVMDRDGQWKPENVSRFIRKAAPVVMKAMGIDQ